MGPLKPHGCMCPLHPLQLLSYLVFAYYVFVFYFLELVAFRDQPLLCYLLVAFYSILACAVIIVAILATAIDPSDPTVESERLKRRNKYLPQ